MPAAKTPTKSKTPTRASTKRNRDDDASSPLKTIPSPKANEVQPAKVESALVPQDLKAAAIAKDMLE
jgi:hypothetical protein